jgi:hypothetical protein
VYDTVAIIAGGPGHRSMAMFLKVVGEEGIDDSVIGWVIDASSNESSEVFS